MSATKIGSEVTGTDGNGKSIKGKVVLVDEKSGHARIRTKEGRVHAVTLGKAKKTSDDDSKTAAEKKAEADQKAKAEAAKAKAD